MNVWQYMLISTLVDLSIDGGRGFVWQYMLISTLVDTIHPPGLPESDSIC